MKEVNEIDNGHVICLMRKLISSSTLSDDLSIGFHRSNEAREKDLNNDKTTEGNYHVRIYLKDTFRFAGTKRIALTAWNKCWCCREIMLIMY